MQYPQGWATYAAEATKKVVKVPVITSHSLRDPEYCEQILAEGKTDLVGLARQLLADPYWPVKAQVREGQVDPQVHLLPRRLLAGVAHGQERDRVLDQRGLRPARLRRHGARGAAGQGRGRRRRPCRHGGGADRDRARPPRDALRAVRRARRRDEVRLHRPGQGEDALVPGLDPGPAPRPRGRHPPEPRADRGRAARLRPRAQRHRRRLVRAAGGGRHLEGRPVRGGDGLPEGGLRVPSGRSPDAQARRCGCCCGATPTRPSTRRRGSPTSAARSRS